MYRMMCWMLSVVLLVAGPLGCTGTTTIRSDPPGAAVTVDGQELGQTPVEFESDQWIFVTHQIVLQKQGYQTRQTEFKRDGELNVINIVAGVFTLVPLFWMFDYRPIHMYKLEPAVAEQGDDADGGAAGDASSQLDPGKPEPEAEVAPQ